MNNQTATIGQIMNDQKRASIRALAVVLSIILYGAVLLYTGIHNFNLFTRVLPPDQKLFAVIVLVCLEGAAVFLPLAIHFWLMPGAQRMVGYMLYGVNWLIVVANTVLDSSFATHAEIPSWLAMYAQYVAPAAPIVIGGGIAMLYLLDPSKALHDAVSAAQAATISATAIQMRQLAAGDDVNAAVRVAAGASLREIVAGAIGGTMQPKPVDVLTLAAAPDVAAFVEPAASPNGFAAALVAAGISEDEALALILERAGQGASVPKAQRRPKPAAPTA